MGKLGGFKDYQRKEEDTLAVKERIQHFKEFTIPLDNNSLKTQAGRCMDCGIPFCHSACPLGNLVPDFNDMVYKGDWKKASEILHATNNFPEFTGRLCPAPCEKACVLGLINDPVSIENIEKNIAEKAFENHWIQPHVPKARTGKVVAVVGSGPAGLAAAQQLNRAGHVVTVFERDAKVGGLLRYGIPNFKLEKELIDRRINILEKEGIIFKTNVHVGVHYDVKNLDYFDAIVLCGGATKTRTLPVKGGQNRNVIQAMEFLTKQTKYLYKETQEEDIISARDKHVIVIGGGDTGSDCIGTSIRQGAKSVTNFEITSKPPKNQSSETPWPFWPLKLKTTSSHEEGGDRKWLISTKEFLTDNDGTLIALKTINVEWVQESDNRLSFREVEGTEKIWPCDLVLLALGFTGPETTLSDQLGVKFNRKPTSTTIQYQTNIPHIFSAGDMRRGQSLIVWAISEGREVAKCVDDYLMNTSSLQDKGVGDLPSA